DDVELLGASRSVHTITRDAIVRLVAVSPPHPLELSRIGIEHDDPAILVAVSDEHLVRLLPDPDLRRTVQVLGVETALARLRVADLHEELAVVCELEDLAVLVGGVAAKPDVAFVVHENAVLVRRPLVARSRSAPRLDDSALLIEFDDRRRWHAAFRGRRCWGANGLMRRGGARPRRQPGGILSHV